MDKLRLKQRLSTVSNPPSFSKLTELELAVKYRVLSFNRITTTYGERVYVDIEKPGSPANSTRIILPQRFSELSSETENLNSSIADGCNITLTYNGPWLNTSNVTIDFEE